MSRQYDQRSTRRAAPAGRGGLGHWIPLALTITVATIGLAAWIWSERQDDEDDDDVRDRRVGPDTNIPQPVYEDKRQADAAYGTTARPANESSGYVARMSGALRRTPSPQQFFDGASRTVVAGVAAAGAVVGSALSSIKEEDKNAYKDHKTWSEEAEARKPGVGPGVSASGSTGQSQQRAPIPGSGKRKTVAVVISADADGDGLDDGDDYHHEHAVRTFTHLLDQ